MILNFINRKSELNALERVYNSKKSEFFIIYGRRRIGKTELIKKFIRNKNHFYYLAKKQNIDLERKEFQKKFSERFNIYLKSDNFEDLFKEILTKIDLRKKFIFIIDEFPYWIIKDGKITSQFQYLWDELLKEKNVFLILCGSYMSIMEKKVLGKESPLYGRRTGQLKIEPMKIKHLKDFLPKYKPEDLIKIYGAVGTVPFYLKEMDDSQNFLDNIKNTFFNKSNILNKEAEFLLREELREVNVYFNIIRTIIEGATRISEIAVKSRVDITNINKYLAVLVELKLIRRIKPITAPPKEKKYLYLLEDNYFRFWLSYVYPYGSEIEEDVNIPLKILEKDYCSYLGFIFEDFCQKVIRNLETGINKAGMEIGKWWHKDKEIDIVALNKKTKEILFGECKWQRGVNAQTILNGLKEKAGYVDWHLNGRKEYYCIFAKSFEKKTKEAYCFDLKDLEKQFLKQKSL